MTRISTQDLTYLSFSHLKDSLCRLCCLVIMEIIYLLEHDLKFEFWQIPQMELKTGALRPQCIPSPSDFYLIYNCNLLWQHNRSAVRTFLKPYVLSVKRIERGRYRYRILFVWGKDENSTQTLNYLTLYAPSPCIKRVLCGEFLLALLFLSTRANAANFTTINISVGLPYMAGQCLIFFNFYIYLLGITYKNINHLQRQRIFVPHLATTYFLFYLKSPCKYELTLQIMQHLWKLFGAVHQWNSKENNGLTEHDTSDMCQETTRPKPLTPSTGKGSSIGSQWMVGVTSAKRRFTLSVPHLLVILWPQGNEMLKAL